MIIEFTGSDGQTYRTQTELARGGEGIILTVAGRTDVVVKRYLDGQATPERAAKLRAMLADPPRDEMRERFEHASRRRLVGEESAPVLPPGGAARSPDGAAGTPQPLRLFAALGAGEFVPVSLVQVLESSYYSTSPGAARPPAPSRRAADTPERRRCRRNRPNPATTNPD